jgi:hypothetical protein
MSDDGGLTPEERAMYAALDEHQAALERIAHEDPCGAAMFGEPYVMDDDGAPPFVDPDEWIDSHLPGKPLK